MLCCNLGGKDDTCWPSRDSTRRYMKLGELYASICRGQTLKLTSFRWCVVLVFYLILFLNKEYLLCKICITFSILYTAHWDAVDLLTITVVMGQGTTWYKSMSLMEEIEKRKKSCYTGYFQVAHISEKIKIQFPVHWDFFCCCKD